MFTIKNLITGSIRVTLNEQEMRRRVKQDSQPLEVSLNGHLLGTFYKGTVLSVARD